MLRKKIVFFFIFFFAVVLVFHLGSQKFIPNAYAASFLDKAKEKAADLYNKAKALVSPQATREDLVRELVPKFARAIQEARTEKTGKGRCKDGEFTCCCLEHPPPDCICECIPYCEYSWVVTVRSLLDRIESDKNNNVDSGFYLLGGRDWASPLQVNDDMTKEFCENYHYLCTYGQGQVLFGSNEWYNFANTPISNVNWALIYTIGLVENRPISEKDLTNAHTGKDTLNFAREALGYRDCIDDSTTPADNLMKL